MDLMVDPLNSLDVSAVPIVLLVDDHGVIRYRNPKPEDVATFLESDYSPVDVHPQALPGDQWWQGDQAVLSGRVDEAIEYYRIELRRTPDEARLWFRLGVALRMRYDSSAGTEQDFVQAVAAWKRARDINPNQYIWRRRIQQFGPRLDKPYPFYNWIAEARDAIQQRGEQPVPLQVEPSGAELASPQRTPASTLTAQAPDPDNKLRRDDGQMVRIEPLVVSSTEKHQRAARVHLILTPQKIAGFAWNNEAEPLQVWIHADSHIQPSRQHLEMTNPTDATSQERRTLEFEVHWPDDLNPADEPLRGYAVYNICDKRTGECMIRRQDFTVHLVR